MAEKYDNATFAHRLKVARVDAKLTQEGLAQKSGIDVNSIARYETGGTTPGFDKAVILAGALGVTLNELYPMSTS